MTEKQTQNVDPFNDVPAEPDSGIAWGAMRSGLESDPNKPGSAASGEQEKVYRHLSPPNIGYGHPDDSGFGPYTVSTLPGKAPQTPPRQAEVDSLESKFARPAIKPEDRNTVEGRSDLEVGNSEPKPSTKEEANISLAAVKGQSGQRGRYRGQRGRRRAN